MYENALVHRIRKITDSKVVQQHSIKVVYDDVIVGESFADLLAEDRVPVELKAVSMLINDHVAQSLNYLRAAGFEICLLINFGRTKVEIKRLRPYTDWQQKNA